MHSFNCTRIWHRITGLACLLASPVCMALPAADKPQNASPVGMAREAMGGGFLLQFASGLLLVLACVIVLAWMMRRFGRLQSSANGTLQLIDGMALSTRERLVLVQVGGTQVLLGVAPGRVEAVHVLAEPVASPEPENPVSANFAVRLREALGKGQPS
jgi:flagellar protein FliO/FliZ